LTGMQDHAFTLYSKKKHELALREHVAAVAKKKGNHKSRWPKLDQTVAKRGAQARPHRAPYPRRARAMPPPEAASHVAARTERPPPTRAQRTLERFRWVHMPRRGNAPRPGAR